MSCTPYKFTTTASTNLQAVRAGQTANVAGIAIVNVATAIYVKLYWFTPTATAIAPSVGTTVPNITIGAAVSANVLQEWNPTITGNGQLWVAVTAAAADGDSANAAAGAIVTILVE